MSTLKCPKCYSSKVRRHSYTESRKQRWSCGDCGFRTVNPLGIEQFDQTIDHTAVSNKIKSVKKSTRWVVVSAQNATPVHTGFYDTLKSYCEVNDAELIVIPFRYKNPTSVFTDKEYEWWHESIVDHIVDRRYELCKGVVLLGDIQIQPTAKSPLSGLEGFTGAKSCIVGHPKYEFKTVATRQGEMAKIMTTTGAITVPNYTRSKAGKTGHHHHQYAATVVESDGDQFYIRQVTANEDGSFIDLDKVYRPNGTVDDAPRAATLVLGDLHQWWVSKEVDEATFGDNGLVNLLNPEKVFIHDSVDGFSISHHHRNDPFIMHAKHQNGTGNIMDELTDFSQFMNERMRDDTDYVVVTSNHDDHITRYIKETDWRKDPENAEFYLETALEMIRDNRMVEGGTSTIRPFDYWMERLSPDLNIINRETSFEVLGVEHAYHGDIGPNGARGSTKNLSQIGVKVTSGHGHSPRVIDGAYTVGVSTGRMAYASGGPSGWLNTHCVLYADGKRSLIHIINGKFRA